MATQSARRKALKKKEVEVIGEVFCRLCGEDPTEGVVILTFRDYEDKEVQSGVVCVDLDHEDAGLCFRCASEQVANMVRPLKVVR